jgi:hypothetical protein
MLLASYSAIEALLAPSRTNNQTFFDEYRHRSSRSKLAKNWSTNESEMEQGREECNDEMAMGGALCTAQRVTLVLTIRAIRRTRYFEKKS